MTAPKRTTLLLTAWLAAFAAAYVLVKVVKIGPVVFVLSAENGWGVHSGDLLALVPVSFAAILTVLAIRGARRGKVAH